MIAPMHAFFPGPRICFGENIGLDSLFTFFAALVVNFNLETIPGQEPSADNMHAGLSVCPHKYCVHITALSH